MACFSWKKLKKVQGKGFEPSDSCETGYLTNEPFPGCFLILSPAPLARLGYPCIETGLDADAGIRTRARGLEGLNHNR